LIENSETYQNKTKFSQEKFLKKKAKKYHQYVVIRKPSIRYRYFETIFITGTSIKGENIPVIRLLRQIPVCIVHTVA
jgi:hypothetical protein